VPDNTEVIVKKKAIVYIDGFNLYFAINEKGWRNLLWLDQVKLAQNLLNPEKQELVAVKYFTSPIKGPEDKRRRQTAYLDALETTKPMLEIFKGSYVENWVECRDCLRKWRDDKEKQTDVNIAVQMLLDAHIPNKVDDMILVTADSDQCPTIKAVKALGRRVLIVLPPGRADYLEVQRAAGFKLELTATKLAACLFPREVITSTGFKIRCPAAYQ